MGTPQWGRCHAPIKPRRPVLHVRGAAHMTDGHERQQRFEPTPRTTTSLTLRQRSPCPPTALRGDAPCRYARAFGDTSRRSCLARIRLICVGSALPQPAQCSRPRARPTGASGMRSMASARARCGRAVSAPPPDGQRHPRTALPGCPCSRHSRLSRTGVRGRSLGYAPVALRERSRCRSAVSGRRPVLPTSTSRSAGQTRADGICDRAGASGIRSAGVGGGFRVVRDGGRAGIARCGRP